MNTVFVGELMKVQISDLHTVEI